MTDIREKLAEIIKFNALGDKNGFVMNSPVVADAILAALPGVVPELEWDGLVSGPYEIEIHEGGIADLLHYGVMEEGRPEVLRGGYLNLISLETLKRIANSHHVAALMEAFGITQKGEQA